MSSQPTVSVHFKLEQQKVSRPMNAPAECAKIWILLLHQCRFFFSLILPNCLVIVNHGALIGKKYSFTIEAESIRTHHDMENRMDTMSFLASLIHILAASQCKCHPHGKYKTFQAETSHHYKHCTHIMLLSNGMNLNGPILRIVKKHIRIKRMIGVHSIKKQAQAFICKRSFYYYYIAHCVFLREIEWQCCSAKKGKRCAPDYSMK